VPEDQKSFHKIRVVSKKKKIIDPFDIADADLSLGIEISDETKSFKANSLLSKKT